MKHHATKGVLWGICLLLSQIASAQEFEEINGATSSENLYFKSHSLHL